MDRGPSCTQVWTQTWARVALLAVLAILVALAPGRAEAFCGFYVAGADLSSGIYNNATMVVILRDGTHTVLSMQNNYRGPPEDFAMVVPVPTVLTEADVQTLPRELFERVDKLAAPRLVEYWEQDPCWEPDYDRALAQYCKSPDPEPDYRGVTIEAEFVVGEYEIAILSARESTGLEAWLNDESYNIPVGAEPMLRPYVASGSKFFVAKVDASKVAFDAEGRTMLSPLRVHYESEDFTLPVRLGLINAPDEDGAKQDLLIHILAREVRYELANYPNVAIPTNLEVVDGVRDHFGAFYASLFDHVLDRNPGAVVTEYAWSADSCDPCPEEPLSFEELTTLGLDLLPSYAPAFERGWIPERWIWAVPGEFVLTRLHARYDASLLGEDLVFQAAPAIVGGLELLRDDEGELRPGALHSPELPDSSFQARYVIRHTWSEPLACDSPIRGQWVGPLTGDEVKGYENGAAAATGLAFVDRSVDLDAQLTHLGSRQLEAELPPLPAGPIQAPPPRSEDRAGTQGAGCAHCSTSGERGALALFLLGLVGLARRRHPR